LVDEKREPILVGLPGRDGQAGTGLWKKRSHCEWVLSGRETDQESEGGQADRLVEGCGRLSLLARMNRPGHADYDMLA
jgi:hypothetical protein